MANFHALFIFYRFVNAFEDQIRSSVESAITKNIIKGTIKLDSLLQTLPKEIRVDDVVALNVTFITDPLFGNSSVKFNVKGLFVSSDKVSAPTYLHKYSQSSISCGEALKMLWISLDEAVFNSASLVYFQVILPYLYRLHSVSVAHLQIFIHEY